MYVFKMFKRFVRFFFYSPLHILLYTQVVLEEKKIIEAYECGHCSGSRRNKNEYTVLCFCPSKKLKFSYNLVNEPLKYRNYNMGRKSTEFQHKIKSLHI